MATRSLLLKGKALAGGGCMTKGGFFVVSVLEQEHPKCIFVLK